MRNSLIDFREVENDFAQPASHGVADKNFSSAYLGYACGNFLPSPCEKRSYPFSRGRMRNSLIDFREVESGFDRRAFHGVATKIFKAMAELCNVHSTRRVAAPVGAFPRIMIACSLILFLSVLTGNCNADEKKGVGNANSILESIDDMWRGESSHAVMKMSVQTVHYKRELLMDASSLGKEKSLIVILLPKKEKGTATLKSGSNIYTYLPKTDRTIKLTSGMMMGSWMGSHLTNDDLVKESRMTDDYNTSITFEGERNGQEEIDFVLDPKPDSAVVWGKIELTARKLADGQYLPTVEKYYDEDGEEVRKVIFSGKRQVGERVLQTIMRVLPTDKPDEFTQLEYQSIKFGVKYTDDDFSLSRLRRSR